MKSNLEEMSYIKKIELEASKISGVVSLAQGIPWFPTPEEVIDFVTEKIKAGATNRYSIAPGIPQLREQIALRYYKNNGVEINPISEIVITAGAIEAISAFLLTTVNVGDEVILIDPSYASYQGCVKIAKGTPVFVQLDENLNMDVEKIKDKINGRTRAIVISNPNNPTGSIFPLEKLNEILEYIKGKNIYLVTDEVYDEFVYDNNEFESAINLFKDYKDNLIVTNSWSKSFGMTGWRVGYMIGNEDIIYKTLKVHDSLVTCAPVHSQWAALATFEIYDERTSVIRSQLQNRRDYAVGVLNKLKNKGVIDFHVPPATYFLFPKFRNTENDYDECIKILHQEKVALVPGSGFGERSKGYFRICFGRDFEDVKEGLKRLEKYFLG